MRIIKCQISLKQLLDDLAVEPVFEGPAAAKAGMVRDVTTFPDLGKRTNIALD
jgi:hypothetical protein